jgi:ATP-dependent Clp protease ATP-binding subunit ClpC
MYERFTDRARKVMQLANQEAQRFNHEYIGTEHILLGLVKEGSGVAPNVLSNLNVDLRKVREWVEKIVQFGPPSDLSDWSRLPLTPRAKKAIDHAYDESRCLKHNHIGPEHLLLGLLREEEGVAAQVLMHLGLKLDKARSVVVNPTKSESAVHAEDPERQPVAEQASEPLSDYELRQVHAYIQRLREEIDSAVKAQDFELAARGRDKLVPLKKMLAWYEWHHKRG